MLKYFVENKFPNKGILCKPPVKAVKEKGTGGLAFLNSRKTVISLEVLVGSVDMQDTARIWVIEDWSQAWMSATYNCSDLGEDTPFILVPFGEIVFSEKFALAFAENLRGPQWVLSHSQEDL